jgi:serine/threonine protein kinase
MLLNSQRTNLSSHDAVARAGEVFVTFDHHTQDSGNVSYGVATPSGRFFVKTAGFATTQTPLLTPASRVSLLRSAVELHRTVSHSTLPALRNVLECKDGPALVFDWIDGELLGAPPIERLNPASAFRRFRRLPPVRILAVLDAVIDLHSYLTTAGWIAVDFYDGCLLYDFAARQIHVVDLDNYHRGVFINRMGRMFGSTRFMAPEEFELGATIDERTTVFVLGRTVYDLLLDHSCETSSQPTALVRIADRACRPDPEGRFPSVAAFQSAWSEARSSTNGVTDAVGWLTEV